MTSVSVRSDGRPTRSRILLAVLATLALIGGLLTVNALTASAADTLLSQGRTATASSIENGGTPASAAVDGNTGTRWASSFSDPQWLQVDLGATATISSVTLNWEAASGKAFQIQTSGDGANWTSIYSTTTGPGGVQNLAVSGSGRYVRMYGTARNTGYGYSLFEFQVYGSSGGASGSTCQTGDAAANRPATASSVENGGTPASAAVDGNTGTRWSSAASDPQWLQVDLGASSTICQVVLTWEAAYGKSFQLQTSNDAAAWTSIYSTTTGAGGTQTLNVTGSGRYVRMYGTARATGYGYSLWSFVVHTLGTGSTPTPTTTTTPPTTGNGTVSSAKKGAAMWNFAGADKAIPDSGITWNYNWSTSPSSSTAAKNTEFVPMVWGAGSVNANSLAQAKANGKTLLTFNEPDLGEQSNMTVDQVLSLWPQLQATGMKLVSPAVAYGGDTAGGWLDRFMSGASAKGYRVDAIALHWYGGDFNTANATTQLQNYITAVYNRYHKPIWLTEYALMRFGPTVTPTADQQAAFVTSSTKMLEGLPFVERYSWFSFPTPTEGGLGTGLYNTDGTATAMGQAYRKAGPA